MTAEPIGLRKRSVLLSGHATSVALEPEFWEILEAMAVLRGVGVVGMIGAIDAGRGKRPLASACRLAVLGHLRRPGQIGT